MLGAVQPAILDLHRRARRSIDLALEQGIGRAASHEVVPGPDAQAPAGGELGHFAHDRAVLAPLENQVRLACRKDERRPGGGRGGELREGQLAHALQLVAERRVLRPRPGRARWTAASPRRRTGRPPRG